MNVAVEDETWGSCSADIVTTGQMVNVLIHCVRIGKSGERDSNDEDEIGVTQK